MEGNCRLHSHRKKYKTSIYTSNKMGVVHKDSHNLFHYNHSTMQPPRSSLFLHWLLVVSSKMIDHHLVDSPNQSQNWFWKIFNLGTSIYQRAPVGTFGYVGIYLHFCSNSDEDGNEKTFDKQWTSTILSIGIYRVAQPARYIQGY